MNHPPPSALAEEDYEAIEAAVMETARGRWFLQEYARRNRNADTDKVLDAVGRIERMVRRERTVELGVEVRNELVDMHRAIERMRAELSALAGEAEGSGRLPRASADLDAVVQATEFATQEILASAERIQETAWHLREKGVEEASCDALDKLATEIYLACSFQDLTGQRIAKVVGTLRFLEARLTGLMETMGLETGYGAAQAAPPAPRAPVVLDAPALPAPKPDAHLLNGPALPGEGVDQQAVDGLMAEEDLFEAPAPAPPIVEPDEIMFADPDEAPEPVASAPRTQEPPQAAPPPRPAAQPRVAGATALAFEPEPEPVAAPAPEPAFDFAELSFPEKVALFS